MPAPGRWRGRRTHRVAPARSATRSSRSATAASVPRVALAACQASSSTMPRSAAAAARARVHAAAGRRPGAALYTADRTSGCRNRTVQPELHETGRFGCLAGAAWQPPVPRRRPGSGRGCPVESAAATSSQSCDVRGEVSDSAQVVAPRGGVRPGSARRRGSTRSAAWRSARSARSIRASGLPPVATAIWAAAPGRCGSGQATAAGGSPARARDRRSGARHPGHLAPRGARRRGSAKHQRDRLGLRAGERRTPGRPGTRRRGGGRRRPRRRTGWASPGRGQQSEHAQTDEEPVRRRAGRSPGGDAQRLLVALRQSQAGGPAAGCVEPVQGGERDGRLGLVAVDPEQAHARELGSRGLEQGGLPDAGLAERGAAPRRARCARAPAAPRSCACSIVATQERVPSHAR